MSQFSFSTTGVEVVSAFADQVRNKTVLITGPSEGGIGAEIAISLAHGNPSLLILAGRTEDKVKPVIQKIREINTSIQLNFVQLDLSDQASVRHAAEQISSTVEKIDIVINNAAIMACPWSKTVDGIESQFATNYLGHFLLTNLLLGKVVKMDGARIINTTSTGGVGGEINFDDVNFEDGETYIPVAAYAQSKVAMMLFSVALASRFDSQKVAAFSVHPGNIRTNLQVHLRDPAAFKSAVEWVAAKTGQFTREEFKTLQQGASTTLVAALDEAIISSSGSYLADSQLAAPQPTLTTNLELAEKLWSLSEGLLHQRFEWGRE
ncbi:hypothetical protein O1611_g1509 [Lasiodiplodia mahajangana]|uniref:Uncharacterized protein n=1 Tax=Lasiodiplodia mahajangana TaxID=1108764 RepID=A0ACC2JX79_9PEZI|nr:hypothetical protein O1611_g1509 [Lasiodiplodia mahajangana]